MHINWTSWATTDDVAKVVVFYEKSTGNKASTGDDGERRIDGADKDHHLSVFRASKNDDFPHCDSKPKPTEATVILMSQAIR